MGIGLQLLQILAVINKLFTVLMASDVSHVYTVHKTAHTWNEARDLCHMTGAQLLTVHNNSDWQLLDYIMSSDMVSHLRPSSRYWFGLHAPDPDQPENFYWDTCDVATFTTPLTHEIGVTSGYECIMVWFHREVFESTYLSMWLKWTACNESYPYICMTPGGGASEDSAVPTTGWCASLKVSVSHFSPSVGTDAALSCVSDCDEIVAPSTSSACGAICGNQSLPCNASYNTQLEVCHLKVDLPQDKEYLNICVLPSLYLDDNCVSSYVAPTLSSVSDDNVNVTNKDCVPQETSTSINTTPTTTDISSLISPTASSTMFVSDSYNTGEPVCICACATLNLFLAEPEPERANLTVEEKIDIIVKELTIDKKNTTSSQRKLISVMDYRASSVGLGSLSAGIIVTIIGVIVAIDLSRLVHGVANIIRKMVKMMKKNKVTTIEVTECPNTDQPPDWSNSVSFDGQQDISDFLRPRKMMTPNAPIDTRF